MKGKSFIAENRELAFKIYSQCGGNVELCLRELAKEGLKISKPTLYDWMEKFNFEDRRTRADAEKQKASDCQIGLEDRMLADLIKQKEKYERYFNSLSDTVIDNQAQFAYASIVKTVIDIRARLNTFKASAFIDFMKELIGYLSKNDPESVPAIERNFDDFMTFAKAKYGA
jgi:hypothetical protein